MDFLDNVTIDMLRGNQRELAETIGLAAYIHLVRYCSGCDIYIAKRDKVEMMVRDATISKEFNGYNYDKLAVKYNLSEQAIRDIIKRTNHLTEQIRFYDS